MSCSVIKSEDGHLVCHIELQPFKQKSKEECFKGIIGRINSNVPDEIKDKLFIRIRDNIESFPLDPSGKRSISTLKRIGLDEKTVPYKDFEKNIFNNNDNKKMTLNKE